MLLNLLALVLLTGLTAASLLVCLAKWRVLQAWEVHRPAWLFRYCLFCAGYWISVLLLLAALGALAYVLGLPWWVTAGALPLGLPAAAVCRAVVGQL